jgi:hypothetical protein
MKWSEIKESIVLDGAIILLEALTLCECILDKFISEEEERNSGKFYLDKIKTRKYHMIILRDPDNTWDDPIIFIRPKGFLKTWQPFNTDILPETIAAEAFSDSCTLEKRKRLITKMIDLSAFW